MSKFARNLSRFVEDGKVSVPNNKYVTLVFCVFVLFLFFQRQRNGDCLRLLTCKLCHDDEFKYSFFCVVALYLTQACLSSKTTRSH